MRLELTMVCVASLAIGACGGESVEQPPPAPVDWRSLQERPAAPAAAAAPTAKERAVAEAYATALAAPDLGGLASRLDADVRFAFPGVPDAHGRDGVVRAHDALFGAFDRRTVSTRRVWRTDAAQCVEWVMSGVQAKAWMGVPPSGKPVTIEGAALLFTTDEGRITDVHVYFDVAVVKAQLGVGPRELIALAPPAVPTGAPEVFEQSGSTDEKANVEVASASLGALESGSEADYAAAFDDDAEIHSADRAAPGHGKGDARAYYKALHRAIGQLDTTIVDAWGVGPFVVIEYRIAGEQRAPLGWIPSERDRVVRLEVLEVDELRGRHVARTWRYDNPEEILSAPKL
jgi:ketosteroid isomerase-like protein